MYGLIMMDYSMPVMDGTVCAKKIRDLLAQHRTVQPRICCVTAYTDQDFKEKALGVGMDEFMSKPVFKNQMQEQLIKAKLIH